MDEVLLVPGARFGPGAGVLMYVGTVVERRGALLHRHTWSVPPPGAFDRGTQDWVRSQIDPVLNRLSGRPLIIGKSLGSVAAILAAERRLPAVWLTPLLKLPWVAEALSHCQAPFLLIGGTADSTWDSETANRLTPHVLEIAGADHGLMVPGPLSSTVSVLGEVLAEVDAFVAEAVHPS